MVQPQEPIDNVTVIGAGLAGAKAVQTLLDLGFENDIVLIGDETERPYERPPLSKYYLQGSDERESVFVHSAEFYDAPNITTHLGTQVTGIDTAQKRLILDGDDDLAYNHLIIATGARPRILDVPGAQLPGITTFRTLGDADRLRKTFEAKPRLVVVGGGFIGSEIAASARAAGVETTIIEPLPTLMLRALGEQMGGRFERLHREHGVELRLGTGVTGFVGDDAVEAVELSDGSRVEADFVVVGVGVVPNDEIARSAGLDCDNGIVVDETLRTSDDFIWACGDVASAYHPLFERHLRVEHWANALNQPQTAARNVLLQDQPTAYDRVPYFYSDQYDLSMEFVGLAEPESEVVVRGDESSLAFTAVYLTDGRVVGAMAVGRNEDVDPAKALISSRAKVDRARLADESTPLSALAES